MVASGISPSSAQQACTTVRWVYDSRVILQPVDAHSVQASLTLRGSTNSVVLLSVYFVATLCRLPTGTYWRSAQSLASLTSSFVAPAATKPSMPQLAAHLQQLPGCVTILAATTAPLVITMVLPSYQQEYFTTGTFLQERYV